MNHQQNKNNTTKNSTANPRRNNSNNNSNNKRHKRNKNNNKDIVLSKGLSWILRHGAPKLGLQISSDGYIPVSIILTSQARNMDQYTLEDVKRIVETNDKQRFKLCHKMILWTDDKKRKYTFVGDSNDASCDADNREEVLCIRANQGHSIKGIDPENLLTPITSSELSKMGSSTIVHGTNKDAWINHIKHEGLNKMNRNHIHFASGLPGDDGVISGMRKNSQVYIYVDGNACARDGIRFYKSANGVILTAGLDDSGILPVRYFGNVMDAKTNTKIN